MATAYKAYSKQGHVTADTPAGARAAFFAGTYDGLFFTVTYGRASAGEWPTFYGDVTKKTELPD